MVNNATVSNMKRRSLVSFTYAKASGVNAM